MSKQHKITSVFQQSPPPPDLPMDNKKAEAKIVVNTSGLVDDDDDEDFVYDDTSLHETHSKRKQSVEDTDSEPVGDESIDIQIGLSNVKFRDKLIDNEMRSFKNRGFHDGYDDGKKAIIKQAFDTGYKKAFEHNFILSTLKGVASALKTSYNSSGSGANASSSSSSSNNVNVNVNISSKHLSMLESMKFDETSDIESIKKDLIKVCRENRLEILAHYVSQIG